MKVPSRELKRRARESLTGHYRLPMAACFFSQLLIFAVEIPFNLSYQFNPSSFQAIVYMLATVILSLLSVVLQCGVYQIQLNLARGKDSRLSDIFYFFSRHPDRMIVATLMLIGLIIVTMLPGTVLFAVTAVLPSDTLFIVGILALIVTFVAVCILALAYSQIYLLLIDHPELKLMEIFRKSRILMQGQKRSLLWLELSFIGYGLLGLLSLGIGFLWITPYMGQAKIEFYRNLIGETSPKGQAFDCEI